MCTFLSSQKNENWLYLKAVSHIGLQRSFCCCSVQSYVTYVSLMLITFISKLSSNFIHSINASHYKHLKKDKIRNIKYASVFNSTEKTARNAIYTMKHSPPILKCTNNPVSDVVTEWWTLADLVVKLRCYSHVEIHIQVIMVSDERFGCCSTWDHVHQRGFYL